MKGRLLAAVAAAALVLIVAAAALLPSPAPPRTEGLGGKTHSAAAYDDTLNAVVFGENVLHEGRTFRVPYGCTYGELFALAGAEDVAGYDLQAPLSFADAVLLGGEYYLYIVV